MLARADIWGSVASLLLVAEQAPANFRGLIELVKHGDAGATAEAPAGAILVDRGQICWAIAPGARPRLTDLLLLECKGAHTRDSLEEIYQRCRRDSLAIGETLVKSGVVPAETLRRILLGVTVDSLRALGKVSGTRTVLVEHRGAAYDLRFAFSPLELLVALGGDDVPREGLSQRLGEAAGEKGFAAAFRRDHVLIAQHGCESLGLQRLLALGTWAIEAVEVGETAASPVRLVARSVGAELAAAAWGLGPLVCALVSQGPSAMDSLLGGWTVFRRKSEL